MGQAKLVTQNRYADWPVFLQQKMKQNRTDSEIDAPIIIDMSAQSSDSDLANLVDHYSIESVVDNYDEQYAELIVSRHPQLYRASLDVKRESLKEYLAQHYQNNPSWKKGSWVYYPWRRELVHVLSKDLLFESRTIRNKNLITHDEQQKYSAFRVGCLGMSVGSNVALNLVLTGGSMQMKIADGAVISASNLNRIVTGVANVGRSKSLVVARNLYEMNPYVDIKRYDHDIDDTSIIDFFEKDWPLDVVVDEIDDLEMKIRVRIEARKRGIPVVMATDLGDNVMLDVERFDLDKNLPLFHGMAGNIEAILGKEVGKQEWLKHAMAIIGSKNISLRMQESLLKVGTELVTQPQLGSTALASGAAAAFAVRQLALGNKLKSERMHVVFDEALDRETSTWRHRRRTEQHRKQLDQALKAM